MFTPSLSDVLAKPKTALPSPASQVLAVINKSSAATQGCRVTKNPPRMPETTVERRQQQQLHQGGGLRHNESVKNHPTSILMATNFPPSAYKCANSIRTAHESHRLALARRSSSSTSSATTRHEQGRTSRPRARDPPTTTYRW